MSFVFVCSDTETTEISTYFTLFPTRRSSVLVARLQGAQVVGARLLRHHIAEGAVQPGQHEEKRQRRQHRRRQHDAELLQGGGEHRRHRSEEHTSELQSLMRTSYAVCCLQNKN